MKRLPPLFLVLLLLFGCKVEGDATVSADESFDTEAPRQVTLAASTGATTLTASPVTFELSARDNEGLAAYLLSTNATTPTAEDADWVTIKNHPKSKTITLQREYSDLGKETLYLWFKDTSDNISSRVSKTFTIDIWPGTQGFGSSGEEDARQLLQDASGNLILLFTSDGDPGTFTSKGGADIYLTQLDSLGNEVWSRQFGGSGDETLEMAFLDDSGNIFITGSTTSDLTGTNAGGTDFFAAKLDPKGNRLWTRQIGSTADDRGKAIAQDPDGNLWVVGEYEADFSSRSLRGGIDVFVLKLSPSGSTKWIKRLATTADDQAWSLVVNRHGAAYVLASTEGAFSDTTALGGEDCLLVKYDADGNSQWMRQIGSSSDDRCLHLLEDQENLILTAQTQGALDGNTSQGGQDVYLLKYNPQAGIKKSYQIGSSALDEATSLSQSADGNYWVTGTTYGSLNGTNAGSGDAFMAAIQADFTLDWITQWGGTGQDEGRNLVEDALGNLAWAVTSASTVTDVTPAGGADALIFKYDFQGAAK